MRVLLVEDDAALSMAVAYRLKKEGMQVVCCEDGASGLEAALSGTFDLILLDRMLPLLDGVDLLRRVRSSGVLTPVLMLTAMDGVGDRVTGLDAGADDYLLKPFAMEELLARLRALSRRPAQWAPRDILSCGGARLDAERCLLSCAGRTAELSRREAQLLGVLMRNAGQVLPRAVILERVWGDAAVEDGNLDIYIHFLRKRLSENNARMKIKTVRGVGYQLSAEG